MVKETVSSYPLRPHVLKPNKTVRLPQYFIAFDCETQQSKAMSCVTHTLRFGCATFFSMHRSERKKDMRENIVFYHNTEFWDFVESHLRHKSRIIVTAHNLAFDLIVTNGINELKQRGFVLSYPIFSHARFIGTAKRKSQTLLFLDTMNYVNTSLRDMGRSLGIEKMEMPDESEPIEKWITYCQRDVEIVVKFWQSLIQFIHDNELGSFGKTAPSLALNTFRHKYMKHTIFIHTRQSANKLERESYFGGRCECFRLGDFNGERLTMLDVNSLYPSVMRDNPFPHRLVSTHSLSKLSRLEEQLSRFYVIARVGIETDEPIYPVRIRNKLVFPIGRIITTLAHPELERAFRRNEIRFILNVAIYEKEKLFTDFIQEMYRFRTEFKSRGNIAFSMIAKMLMNSLYGKFGQRGHHRKQIPNIWGIQFGREPVFVRGDYRLKQITIFDGIAWYEEERGESYNSFPAIASGVASYARLKLWDLITLAGKANVFYCDTDSLIVNQQGLENLKSEINESELGKLKTVWSSNRVQIRGLKDYRVDERDTIKGIRTNARAIDTNTFEQTHFSTFLESIRTRRVDSILETKVIKRLSRTYDKGLVGADGFVSPLVLTDF